MTFGERLTELRISHGYNKRNEFADKLGIPSTTLRNYETDAREPGHTFLKQISELFNVSVDYLLCITDEREVLNSFRLKTSEYEHVQKYRSLDPYGQETVSMVLGRELQRVKSLNELQNQLSERDARIAELEIATIPTRIITYYQSLASAGTGEYLFDNIPTDTLEVLENDISEQADFVIGVNGDSMAPTYRDGDKVYVRITDEIPNGSIGVFTRGNDCFIKELGVDCLISHNHTEGYEDISVGEEDIKLVGEVLGKVEEL